MNIGDKYTRGSRCAEVTKITSTEVTYRFTDAGHPDRDTLITVSREEFNRLKSRTVKNGVATVPASDPAPAGDVVRLLDECASAMRAAKSEVANRDLAIALEDRATRCRVMIRELVAWRAAK